MVVACRLRLCGRDPAVAAVQVVAHLRDLVRARALVPRTVLSTNMPVPAELQDLVVAAASTTEGVPKGTAMVLEGYPSPLIATASY